MGLFKRRGVFYGRVKNDAGKWVAKTLNTSDRVVAKERYRDLERRLAIPSYRAAHETTLRLAADEFVTSRKIKGCAQGTLDMYGVKLRQLKRLLGEQTPLIRIDAPAVDKYIAKRLKEGASRNTIGKELTALRGVLKIAKRAGKFPADLDAVLPVEWSSKYEPRRTALTPAQVDALVNLLARPRKWEDKLGREYERKEDGVRMNRASLVAFIVATGARWSEALRAERSQIDTKRGLVYFRITKTAKSGKREKYVPITSMTKTLLDQVLAATAGRARLFEPWKNAIRDLRIACNELEIPVVTPNDLRRTHANWLRDAGVDTASIADVLGHVDSRMVEKVYGKLRPEQLRDRVLSTVSAVVH